MIKDRGTMKWTAIMLPELVEQLQDAFYEDANIVRNKPVIDEHQRAEFDEQILYAMEYNYPVEFITWHEGYKSVTTGNIHFVDKINEHIRIKLLADEKTLDRVYIADIIGVKVLELDGD